MCVPLATSAISVLIASAAIAFDAELAWSSVQSAAGYRVYVRQAGQQHGGGADVGRIQADMNGIVRYVERGLQSGVTNYFAVSAYNASGARSTLSNEIALLVSATQTPTRQPATPASSATPSRTSTTVATPVPTRNATLAPTSTPTAGWLFGVRGAVRYYAGARPVPGVSVTAQGLLGTSAATSDIGGLFSIGLGSATWTVEPQKQGDIGDAVGAFDAAYVLQAVAGRRNLDARQAMACDVTANGALTALDATRILQFTVGQFTQFAAAEQCGSDWLFVPEPLAIPLQQLVQPSLATCQGGAISFLPLLGLADGQDFAALVLGDCTGNWSGGGSGGLQLRPHPPEARLEPARSRHGARWIVPLSVTSDDEFVALTARIGYDPSSASFDRLDLIGMPDAAVMRRHDDGAGLLALAIASSDPIARGEQQVALLFFDAAEEPVLQLLGVEIDDVPARLVDGSLTLDPPLKLSEATVGREQ